MKNDTVLIIEPDFSGHRWRYAQWAANAYMEAGLRCLIVTEPRNAGHPLVKQIQEQGGDTLGITFVAPPEQSGRKGLGSISYVRAHGNFKHAYAMASRERNVALVVVPYVDYFLLALPFLRSPFGDTPWVGVTMRSNFHHHLVGVRAPRRPLVNAVKSRLFARAIRVGGMKTLLTIDPTLPDWWKRNGGHARGTSIDYLADPFPDAQAAQPSAARQRLGLSKGTHVLVYGAINDRKGIFELIDALAQRNDGVHAPRLVIAGAQDNDVRALLTEAAGKLAPAPIVMDRFISSETELDLFSACDVVWLGYKGHYGMSGVLVQAFRFGKPVIATADGLIGWFCRTGELGPVIDDLTPASINRALDDVLARRKRPVVAGHLLERNTLGQFKETLRQAMA
ncbi:glycosyltransferase [Caballeronia sp. LZ062]|uniref:glycosyltransferase n=1 Tax=unclassified Caballeronia TaxID=2646786 RepID=UPI00285F6F12|nr:MULTISPECIES: glycosyltransferase [unclassified Caballeronia]MDR5855159.1 glycosyltransferase [Caballeronia sp. LZ050]MDR5870311.1 glycosyltransferase [Caballeronia sp. LZ062]